MKQIPLWQSPKTSRAYLHPSGARRLISIYPDMKITDLDLGDQGRHYNQPGFGVHLIFGSEPGDCDMEKTEWDKPSGGIPMYVLNNEDGENGCSLRMSAFSVDPDRDGKPEAKHEPLTYCRLEIRNPNAWAVSGTAGILPRYNALDHYLTGLHDTGYEPYNPNVGQWYLSWKNRFAPVSDSSLPPVDGVSPVCTSENGYGWVCLLDREGGKVRWVSREEQKNRFRAHDYFRFDYRLGPGEVCLFSAGCMIRELRFDLFITAETDAALQVIPAEVCQGLMTESVVLSNFIGTILAKRFSQVMERVDQILWQRLDRRLAAFLLEEAALRGTDVLSITHEGISHHLGCAREVVTRLLSEFREEGWVALRRGTVELLDREALSDLGKL